MSYGGVMVDNSSVNFYYMLRPKRKQIKQIATETIYHYRDCADSYDRHSKAQTVNLFCVVTHTSMSTEK